MSDDSFLCNTPGRGRVFPYLTCDSSDFRRLRDSPLRQSDLGFQPTVIGAASFELVIDSHLSDFERFYQLLSHRSVYRSRERDQL